MQLYKRNVNVIVKWIFNYTWKVVFHCIPFISEEEENPLLVQENGETARTVQYDNKK